MPAVEIRRLLLPAGDDVLERDGAYLAVETGAEIILQRFFEGSLALFVHAFRIEKLLRGITVARFHERPDFALKLVTRGKRRIRQCGREAGA